MTTSATLREVAAFLNAEADKMDAAAAPVTPPPVTPPPPVSPPPTETPNTSLGVQRAAFTAALRQLTIAGRAGVTTAIAFPVGADAKTVPVKLSVTPANDATGAGDAPTYRAWVSATPAGDPIGPVVSWPYTGGSLNATVPGGPFWAQVHLDGPGQFHFNVKNDTGEAPFFASLALPGAWPMA